MKTRWLLGCALLCAVVGVAAADKAKPAKSDKKSDPKSDKAAAAAPAPDATGSAATGGEVEAEPGSLASRRHIMGPKQVDLGHHVTIDVPAGMALFEQTEARALMTEFGNNPDHTIAVIFPTAESAQWWVAIDAIDDGYVNDSDADELDAGALLEQIKEGTAEQNKKRVQMGVSELFIDGWAEPPHYEHLKHHLVWSINAHESVVLTSQTAAGSAAPPPDKTINFSTRYLGRNGFVSVNIVTPAAGIAQAKVEALPLLDAMHFVAGFRYEDHVSGDRDSGMGLKALIVGGTAVVLAKKGGILIAILLALKKGFIVVIVAIGAFFKRMFGGGKKRDDALASSLPDSSSGTPPDQGPPSPPDSQGSA